MRARVLVGVLLAVLGGLALVVVGPTAAYACRCVPYSGVETPLGRADAVAVGEVTEVQIGDQPVAVYVVETERVFTGDVRSSFEVRSPVSAAACGLQGIRQGRRYVFFLSESDQGFVADSCGGTRSATPEYVDEVAAATGSQEVGPPADQTADPTGGEPDREGAGVLPWLGAAAFVALLVSVAVTVSRARRGKDRR